MIVGEQKRGPVIDGRIQHLSVSTIAKFNPAEEGCKLRFWYKYVQGRQEPAQTWHEVGNQVDAQLEHYLLTGEDVLGKIARAGKELLPAPGAELLLQWGLNDKPRPKGVDGKWKNFFPPEQSLVFAAGIPLVGFADLFNGREEHLVPKDDYGLEVELKFEANTPEVVDFKTSKSFIYAKKGAELIESTQMNGYGVFLGAIVPDAVAVRLSHNVFLSEGSPKAIKRSVLVSMQQVRDRWRAVVDPIAEDMKSVAATKREQDVVGNLEACRSFGGCPHQGYCHQYKSQSKLGRLKMGLLKGRQTPAPNGVAVAVPNGVPAAAALAPVNTTPWISPPVQTAPVVAQAPAVPGFIPAEQALQGQQYIVNNVPAMFLSAAQGKLSFLPVVNGNVGGTPILVEYGTMVFPLPSQAAAPQVVAATAPAPIAPRVERDAGAPPPVVLAPPPMLAPPVATAAAEAPAPAKRGRKLKVEVVPSAAPVAPAAAAVATGVQLYVNAVPNGPFIDLAGYVAEAALALQEQFGVVDIRAAGNDSPLAYFRWRGMLAQVVKEDPPPPGSYVAFTHGSELLEIAVEALAPICAPGFPVRGAR